MAKHIAVFCDGTWNSSDAAEPTNVVKLAQAVVLTPARGPVQQVIYVPGVGTGRGSTGLARWLDRLAGGAFGLGLNLTLEEAYRALVFAHEPGDRIFLFGFSRGAYMARSLAGLLRASGLPPRQNLAGIRRALARYRSPAPSTRPDRTESFAFRLGFAPELHTSQEEHDWRVCEGHPPGVKLQIAYVGVWDTVGTLGVPGHYGWLARMTNGAFEFHDTDLSSLVQAARHAVAVDELRRSFAPALWENLDGLNARRGGAPQYLQLWFPGVHGAVGGGGDRTELSDRALRWIADGAAAQGLRFRDEALPPAGVLPPPDAPLRNRSAPPSAFERVLALTATNRCGPKQRAEVAPGTADRWTRNPGYRPRTLDRVSQALTAEAGAG